MTEITKQEANKLLAAKVAEFEKCLAEAEAIADEHGLEFHIEPCYGAGAYYTGKTKTEDEWQESDEGGWTSSSQSC